MAINAAVNRNSFDRYIEEVRSLWSRSNDDQLPFKVRDAMERFLRTASPEESWLSELIREAKPSRELYRDPDYGFIQMGHVHPDGHGNLPHDHGPCWVVYGAYQGLTEITLYERTDDGRDPKQADLEKKELHQLSGGVVYPYTTGQIHSTRAVKAPAVVFRFLSADLNKIRRRRYDPDTGAVTLIEPTS